MQHWRITLLVLVAYGAVAVAATWPLATHLFTHLPGDPSGDTGVYVWNLWNFRHEVVDLGRSPLSTSSVFSLTPRANLSLHNYTLLADVFAFPLIPVLGTVASYNVLLMAFVALNGWATFLLARYLTRRPVESWVAGALFAASPALIARTTAHFSLVAAFPLPLVVLTTLRGLETGKRRYAAATGGLVAVAGFCDPYYAIFAVLLIGGVAACHVAEWQWRRRPAQRLVLRALDLAACATLGLVTLIVVSGGRTFMVMGTRVAAETLYTPMLVVTVLALARLAVSWRLSVSLSHPGRAVRFAAVSAAVCLTGLSPTLYGMGQRLVTGRFDRQVTLWRSSPPGVDLLAFVLPNPNQSWFGPVFQDWLLHGRADGFAEFTAAIPWVVLAVIAWACIRRRGAIPKAWILLPGLFALLALGPFIEVGGLKTHIPGPWALLRYVPVLEWARAPSRFAIPAALLTAVLFAFALVLLRDSGRRGRWASVAVCGVLLFELMPMPRPLAAASVPAVFDTVKADQDPRVRILELPTGIRDGLSSLGNFSAATQFRQTYHGKRLVGGYLSRVSQKRKSDHLGFPVFSALVTLSEGRPLTREQEWRAWQERGTFLRRSRIGYVVFDHTRTSPRLREFAIALFDLQAIARLGPFELLRPRTPLIAGQSPPLPMAAATLEFAR